MVMFSHYYYYVYSSSFGKRRSSFKEFRLFGTEYLSVATNIVWFIKPIPKNPSPQYKLLLYCIPETKNLGILYNVSWMVPAKQDKFLHNLFLFLLFLLVGDGSIVDQRQRVPRLSSSRMRINLSIVDCWRSSCIASHNVNKTRALHVLSTTHTHRSDMEAAGELVDESNLISQNGEMKQRH